jgi:hypothetical protein
VFDDDDGATALTTMANAARVAVVWALLTLITILPSVPTSEADGFPESEPVTVLNVAQDGLLRMVNE